MTNIRVDETANITTNISTDPTNYGIDDVEVIMTGSDDAVTPSIP